MIADIPSNKTFHPVVMALFIRGRQLKTCLVFIACFYYTVPKILG